MWTSSAVAEALAEAYGPSIETLAASSEPASRKAFRSAAIASLLTQAIANLLENSIRHTGPGTHIGLTLSRHASGPALRVEDDGPGVPEAERARILGRFHRLDPSRSDGGSGLGLTLVAAVAELHEATLTLDASRADGQGRTPQRGHFCVLIDIRAQIGGFIPLPARLRRRAGVRRPLGRRPPARWP